LTVYAFATPNSVKVQRGVASAMALADAATKAA